VDVDDELGLGDVGMGADLIEFRARPPLRQMGCRRTGCRCGWVDGRAGVADGGDEASQLGSAPATRLDQRRVGDGFGDFEGVGVILRAVDAEFDDVGDAFTVGNDLAGERGADLGEAMANSALPARLPRRWLRSEQQDRVVGEVSRRRRCG